MNGGCKESGTGGEMKERNGRRQSRVISEPYGTARATVIQILPTKVLNMPYSHINKYVPA